LQKGDAAAGCPSVGFTPGAFDFAYFPIRAPAAVQPAFATVQPPISTIHCKTLNQSLLPSILQGDSGSTCSPRSCFFSPSSLYLPPIFS